MKIVYVWVNYFRDFRNFGFNLGSEYIYDFQYDEQSKKAILNRKSNDNYIRNLFDPFVNISAIVGENASGKSSIIEAIRQILCKQRDGFHYFILYQDEDKLYCSYHIGIEERKIDKLSISHNRPIEIKIETNGFKIEHNITHNSETIFFSQLIDLNIYPLSHDRANGIDISSNWLSFDDIQEIENSSLPYHPLSYHKSCETRRQVQFVLERTADSILQNFALPSEIEIYLYSKSSPSFHNTPYSLRPFRDVMRAKINIAIAPKADNKTKVFLIFLTNLIEYLYTNFERSNHHLDTRFNITTTEAELKSLLPDKILQHFLKHQDLFDGQVVIDFIEIIHELIMEGRDEDYVQNIYWAVDVSDKILNLLDRYNKLLVLLKEFSSHPTEFLSLDWRNLSTGEKAYLNLFSRFHHAKKQIEAKIEHDRKYKKPDIIYILIDEGEIGFHLQWQKSYIDKLYKTLPELLKLNEQNIKYQLIFTTHSPLSLSDIPNDRIIYLSAGKVLSKKGKSFGANITDLISNSFFIHDGLMGYFAKEKINKTIEWLRDKDNRSNSDYHRSLIANIDEPIIQSKLAEMYSAKMNDLTEKELKRAAILRMKEDFEDKYGDKL